MFLYLTSVDVVSLPVSHGLRVTKFSYAELQTAVTAEVAADRVINVGKVSLRSQKPRGREKEERCHLILMCGHKVEHVYQLKIKLQVHLIMYLHLKLSQKMSQ